MWDSDCMPFVVDELRTVYGLDENTYGHPPQGKPPPCLSGPHFASPEFIPAWPSPLDSYELAEQFSIAHSGKIGGLSQVQTDIDMVENGVSFIYGSASLTGDLPCQIDAISSWGATKIDDNREQDAKLCRMACRDTGSLDALQVGCLLKSGSFGQVHKGTWFGAEVAVKVVWDDSEFNPRDAFKMNELKIATMMHHPNVVRTFDWIAVETLERETTRVLDPGSLLRLKSPISKKSKERRVHLIVMEKSDMGTLADFFDQSKDLWFPRVNTDVVMETLKDIASGLMYMHDARVVHADLKPSNILLFPSGNKRGFVAKLSDFGISCILPECSDSIETPLTGNLAHSAPEYMREGVLSTASDVFGFGVVMWELFTGKCPYHDHPNVMFAVWNKEPLEFPSNCPVEYKLLSERCSSLDPIDRPTMAEILDCLNDMDIS